MGTYCELAPPPEIAEGVACLWIARESGIRKVKRVTPDGCADIIYTRWSSNSDLSFVGTMTRYRDFDQPFAGCWVGIRFRPGMWNHLLRISGPEAADRMLPLEDFLGRKARELIRQLNSAEEPSECARILAKSISAIQPAGRSPFQKAIGAMEKSHGQMTIDEAAQAAGFSTRQFRRRCLEATGLSPKLLARIIRFRRASGLVVPMSGEHAGLAVDCGYTDQSHLIAEFQELAGQTPREMAAIATIYE